MLKKQQGNVITGHNAYIANTPYGHSSNETKSFEFKNNLTAYSIQLVKRHLPARQPIFALEMNPTYPSFQCKSHFQKGTGINFLIPYNILAN